MLSCYGKLGKMHWKIKKDLWFDRSAHPSQNLENCILLKTEIWSSYRENSRDIANKLTIFSVLIELSEATKSWHDTFVGTPGKDKENCLKIFLSVNFIVPSENFNFLFSQINQLFLFSKIVSRDQIFFNEFQFQASKIKFCHCYQQC